MPHQCLNCGRIIEKGSKEILKGCTDCGGKKFMFVDAPLPQKEREDLKRKADRVRDEMIRKADPHFLEMLKEKGIGNLDGAKVEMDKELGDDWVRVQLDGAPELEISEGEVDTGLEVVRPTGERPSAKDLISQFDRELEEKKKHEEVIEAGPSKKAKPRTKGRRPGKPKKEAAETPDVKRRAPRRKKEKHVDVINIIEQGVYEIDVKRLLEDNPIVIQKDGSYLIHLPSVFKEGREKAKK
ncbi:MAG: Zn-ribbon containing protein [Thermoplasmatota archaeon]